MKLKDWIKKSSTYDLRALARKVKVHPQYIYQIAKFRCSPGLAKRIEAATKTLTPDRIITKEELRPDVWEN